jgi:flagellar biosynthesis/type III secretory pathway chaperone
MALSDERKRALLDEFWRRAERIESAWDYLESLTDAEWQALLKEQLFQIHKFAQKKEALAAFIEREERVIQGIIQVLTPGGRKGNGEPLASTGTLDALFSILDHRDAVRLDSWRIRRQQTKRRVHAMNRKIVRWTRDRLDFLEGLESVFLARHEEKDTYCNMAREAKGPFLQRPSGHTDGSSRRGLGRSGPGLSGSELSYALGRYLGYMAQGQGR